MSNLEILSKRLIEVRKMNGYTRKRLAEELNKPYRTITNYETGEHEPGHKYIVEIAKKFGVTTDYLLGRTDTPHLEVKESQLSIPEQEHIKKYRPLDPEWKEAVDSVLDIGYKHYQAEQQARADEKTDVASELAASRNDMEAAEEIEYFTIPIYSMPLSAGTGQEADQEYPEDFLLKKRPPRGTSYIAHVSGDSMEPTYHDGDLVFIYSTLDIRVGQIGAFFMDGQMWIKELGDGVLISHNPDYPPRPMTEDIRCQGLVLGVCDESYFE